jgi:septal ring-binding cell division protein DamX
LSDDERKELRAYPADRAGGDLGRPASGEREQADIARLLRALNDDLRDDPPVREGGIAAPPPPQQQPSLRGPGRRPSLLLVGVAIIAAAAIGLGSLLFTGSGPSPAPGRVISARPGGDETPPALIARAGGDASAPAVSGPLSTGVAPFVPSAPVVVPPSQVPASPRLLTPGQTATIVRPTPVEPPPSPAETPSAGGATVVVQPLAPAPAAPVASPPPAAPRVVASPAPKPVPTTPAKPAPVPAPAPASASAGAVPGGPGHWAVQVGTFSVAGNAEQLVRKLGQNGRSAYVVEWQDRQGRTWKAVRVGNFTSESSARAAVGELKTRMDLTGQLINLR